MARLGPTRHKEGTRQRENIEQRSTPVRSTDPAGRPEPATGPPAAQTRLPGAGYHGANHLRRCSQDAHPRAPEKGLSHRMGSAVLTLRVKSSISLVAGEIAVGENGQFCA